MREVDRFAHRAPDQAGLVLAGEQADLEAGAGPHLFEELLAVGGLAHRAGRHRHEALGTLEPGEGGHAQQGVEAVAQGAGGKPPFPAERTVSETDHLALAVEGTEAAPAVGLDHDHVDGVRTDVDRRQALAGGGRRERAPLRPGAGRSSGTAALLC